MTLEAGYRVSVHVVDMLSPGSSQAVTWRGTWHW